MGECLALTPADILPSGVVRIEKTFHRKGGGRGRSRPAKDRQQFPGRIHALRHSHAALLVELGYSIVAVAERLGDTVEAAMSTYTHLYPNKMAVMAEDLDREAMTDPAGSSGSSSLADVADRLEAVENGRLSD